MVGEKNQNLEKLIGNLNFKPHIKWQRNFTLAFYSYFVKINVTCGKNNFIASDDRFISSLNGGMANGEKHKKVKSSYLTNITGCK